MPDKHKPVWFVPVLISVVCVLIAIWGEEGRQLLRYDRDMLAEGQVWRAISAHFAHLDIAHTLLNVVALFLLYTIFADVLTRRDWVANFATSAIVISIGLFVFDRQTDWYVGLSGVLHGVFVAGAIKLITQHRSGGWLMLAVVAAKLALEQTLGAMPTTAWLNSGPVVVDAHLYGAFAGLAVGGAGYLRRNLRTAV